LQRTVTCLWEEPLARRKYRTAVSVHGHTNHSKESLYFIAEFARKHRLLRRALACQERRARAISAITVDFDKAYWTPPMTPLAAYRLEKDQIENRLGLASMVSLTDHDTIEAPTFLRVMPETEQIPVSMEWSVPFRDVDIHIGLHNLPAVRAAGIVADLNHFTKQPDENRLAELLSMLHENPDVLVVLNHPLWDMAGIGKRAHRSTLSLFAAKYGMFLHAFELGGLRSWEENQEVVRFAEGWNMPIIGGGDRHGSEPSAVVNVTQAESFTEFIHEVRRQQRTHLLFMPQYAEPHALRVLQTLLDVIREYPEYPVGSRRWDERVFHPDRDQVIRPLSALWRCPAPFIQVIFRTFRLLELHPIKTAIQFVLAKPEHQTRFEIADGKAVP
jgi:hypothetical protein